MKTKCAIDPYHLDKFIYWMTERHKIWLRRFVMKSNCPWTDDPLLRDYKFTNTFRELDRGTIWYLENVAFSVFNGHSKFTRPSLVEFIWKTSVYRLLNRIETFEKTGIPSFWSYSKDKKSFEKSLRAVKATGAPVFTSAHLTCPCPKGVDKIGGFILALDELNSELPCMVDKIILIGRKVPPEKRLQSIHEVLQTTRCMGHFIAYEVVTDMAGFGMFGMTQNDWANAGPGARKGLRLIFGESFNKWDEGMRALLPLAREAFSSEIFQWKDIKTKYTLEGVSLRTIEHSLCEYGKYDRLSNQSGKTRMVFHGKDPSHSTSPSAAKIKNVLAKVRWRRLEIEPIVIL